MRDFSNILLIHILRATVDQAQESSNIDQTSPGFLEFKRTLVAEIVRRQASDPGPGRFMVDGMPEARNEF